MKNLFVGNLPWSVDDQKLESLFGAYGDVHSAKVIQDRDTGRSRGFGFVEMDDEAAMEAVSGLNETEVDGRAIRVNEAQDRPQRKWRRRRWKPWRRWRLRRAAVETVAAAAVTAAAVTAAVETVGKLSLIV